MGAPAFALFGTALGPCGIVWKDGAVIGTALPDADETQLKFSFLRRFPDAAPGLMPPFVAALAQQIRALLAGGDPAFTLVHLDFSAVEPFERRVYELAFAIPRGETRTYGQLATGLETPGAARAVGRALGRNPFPIVIPCHRILAADGASGGFSAPGGARTKMRLLDIEGARRPGEGPGLFDALPWQIRS